MSLTFQYKMEGLTVMLQIYFCIASVPTAAYNSSCIISGISRECSSILERRSGLIAYLQERDNC